MLFGFITRAWRIALPPFELRCGFGDRLEGGPLFGRHGPRDRFDQLVLHMK